MAELLMFEVDVKNVTKGRRREGGDQLRFGVLIIRTSGAYGPLVLAPTAGLGGLLG